MNQNAFDRENPSAQKSGKKQLLLAGLLVLGLGGVAYAMYARPASVANADPNEVAKELRERGRDMEDAERRERLERLANLTDEEKATLDPEAERLARRANRFKEMEARVNGYFKAPLDERDKYLDDVIDDIQKMTAEREKERARRDAERAANGEPPRGERGPRGEGGPQGDREGRPGGGEGRPGGGGGRGGWGGGSANGNSANTAKFTEFAAALNKRAKERGIELPFGRGRGRGR